MRRILILALLLGVPAGAQPPEQFMEFVQPGVHVSGGFSDSDYALSFASPTGIGMGTECANADVTTAGGTALTVTRAGTATCTKADGTLVAISANKPVIRRAPGTSQLALYGERAITNPVQQNTTLGTTWTATNATVGTADTFTDPYGTTTAESVESTSAGGYIESNAFVIASGSAMAGAYVRVAAGTQAVALVLRDTTAGVDRCTDTHTASTTWSTWDVDLKANCASVLTNGNTHVVRFYPGGVAGTGTAIPWGFQVGPGTALTTYAGETAGTSITRNAPLQTLPTTTFMSNTAGCFGMTVYTVVGGGQLFGWAGLNRLSSPSNTTVSLIDGSTTITSTVTSIASRAVDARAGWQTSDTSMFVTADGVTATGTYDGTIVANPVAVGSNPTPAAHQDGFFYNVRFHTTKAGCAL